MTIRWPHRCGGVLLLALVCASGPRADEGMWTFDNAPRKLWKERYGFEPTDAWLDHLRLSSVRLIDGGGGGGSASFVSANGLVLTNQHVAGGQLQKLSTAARDLVRDGFYARTRAARKRRIHNIIAVAKAAAPVATWSGTAHADRVRDALTCGASPASRNTIRAMTPASAPAVRARARNRSLISRVASNVR